MRPDPIAASFSVLRKNKQLAVFPILSAIAAVLVALAFFALGTISENMLNFQKGSIYVLTYVWYCASAFAVIFFNCALAACAQECLAGGNPTVGYGIRRAVQRVDAILLWAIITCSVGLILRAIERRVPLAGKVAVWLFGAAWSMTTYLVVPVLIVENQNAIGSIRRSSQLFRQTWGTQLVSGIRFGWRYLVYAIPGIIIGALGANYYPPLLALAFIYFVCYATAMSAATNIFHTALYRQATGAQVPSDWPSGVMSSAFRPTR